MIRKALGENDPQDDTGYESGNSHKNNAGAKNIDTLDAGSGSTTSTSSNSKATTTKLNASISVNCITSTSL